MPSASGRTRKNVPEPQNQVVDVCVGGGLISKAREPGELCRPALELEGIVVSGLQRPTWEGRAMLKERASTLHTFAVDWVADESGSYVVRSAKLF